ncbi:MAG TPA: cell division protein ZapA [Steroidobacteraceae bacterium]|jgi:cell division protein ZapA|nr:cell division protein ZapA [Steroidobacteraceae bacterium]
MSEREANRPLSVRILEKEYFVACPPEERAALLDSAELLNGRMKEIRDSGKIVGLDRIAVMAALNLAHEVIRLRTRDSGSEQETTHRLRHLRERVEAALENGQQLEL